MDNKPQEIPTEVRSFLESLLMDAGMTMSDPILQEALLNEVYIRLDNYLTGAIMDKLAPDQLETFIQMNEQKKPKPEIEAFIKEKIPQAEEFFANTFLEFRDEYLGKKPIEKNAGGATA